MGNAIRLLIGFFFGFGMTFLQEDAFCVGTLKWWVGYEEKGVAGSLWYELVLGKSE